MINAIIRASLRNRGLVLLLAAMLTAVGVYSFLRTPVDALPDLSDVQVIVRTPYPGQAPRVVEDQVTYPLTTALLSVPGATTVRGYSFYGDSFVNVLFADGTDPYWARSRVLEYLSQAEARLPSGVRPSLGPDATGVGWIYQYALVDRTGKHDLAQLRSIQDWFLKFELQALDGVAEAATIGGMVKQYQVVVDPVRLRGYGLQLMMIEQAIRNGNQEVGGSVIEMAEAEYMVRATGYVTSVADLERIPVMATKGGTPVLLRDVADVRIGPEMRRGIGELDGEGEAVGGVVVMRNGDNARDTIVRVKEKLNELRSGLPAGVEIVETYDRSALIQRSVDNLKHKLLDEFIVVALVCFVFLYHVRSGLIVVIVTPIAVLSAFIVMHLQGINANIMSLGGIAIAIGTLVDAAIVMIENVHKKLEHVTDEPGRMDAIFEGCREVGPSLFFSLMIVALSFLPVFTLEAQEGRMFAPLAYTKTYAMVWASVLSITLVPVLIYLLVRGEIKPEAANPVNRATMAVYRPFLELALRAPWGVTIAATVLVFATLWPASQLGTEFMPELDEGDFLYMPTTLPGLSTDAARALLQQTDKLIKTVPEVERVFGKAGRAESATDPAPIEMFETTIKLKPRAEWRPGMTPEKLKAELDARVNFPGVSNAWVYPIKTRIDMLATGIRTPVGIKIMGPDLGGHPGPRPPDRADRARGAGRDLGVRRAHGHRPLRRRRHRSRRCGPLWAQHQGRAGHHRQRGRRHDGQLHRRGPRALPDQPALPAGLPQFAAGLARAAARHADRRPDVTLQDVAKVEIADGPAMIRSENARPSGWVFIDMQGRDLGGFVGDAKQRIAAELKLPPGYSLGWSGQYEYLERAVARLKVVLPLTLGIIVLLLYLNFRNARDVLLILGALPFALVGGVWLLYLLGYDLSIAAAVGFIALAGVAAETGVVMVMYLEQAWAERRRTAAAASRQPTREELREAIVEGALLRLRPKLMTVITIIVGLLPIMWGSGTGSEVMRRIAAPMVGGMISATVLTLVIIPSLYLIVNGWKLSRSPGG